METNKKKKQLKILFLLLTFTIILSFYILYTTFLDAYNQSISAFLYNIKTVYPEITVSQNLFQEYFVIELNWQIYLLIFLLILCLVFLYYYISHSYKAYSHDIQHIIHEIDYDEFTPSSLEGELSLLEEKIYYYKKRNDKLVEKSMKEKKQLSDYIENIAHQIKTPITAIRLNEEMSIVKKDTTLLEKNKNAFERLDSLFDNFMKLSRIENDTIHFQLEAGSMKQLLDDIYDQILPLLKETKIVIDSCDSYFYYDSQWLCEAIYNIIKNCIEEGVSLIEVKAFYNNEMNHIIIRDNGRGINEEDLPYIFDRFYRSRKNKKQGAGIGLALSKEIVEKHHGFINAYNEDGAVFDLAFPLLDIKEKVI